MIKRIIRAILKPLMNEGGFLGGAIGALGGVDGAIGGVFEDLNPFNALKKLTDVDEPEVSEQEAAIQKQLMDYLGTLEGREKEQYAALLSSLGILPGGGLQTFGQRLQGYDPRSADIYGLLSDKFKGLLGGGDYVDPALERNIADYERIAGQETRSQLGRNFLRSSPGPQKLANIYRPGIEARHGARRDYLGLLGQQLLGTRGQLGGLLGQRAGQVGGLYNPQTLLQGYGQALNQPQTYNLLGYEAGLQTQANRAGLFGDFLGLGGTLGGAAIGAA